MKIAVTGGSGGVGRAITTVALKQGHSVVSIDRVLPTQTDARDNLLFIEADARDYGQMVAAFEGCDAVIHMAAIPAPGKHEDDVIHNLNVVASYNALRAAVEHNIMRICQASSVNAIGHTFSRAPRYDYFPIDEEHANYNEEPYSLSKWICEAQADSFARRYEDISIASMRFHYIVPERSAAGAVFNRSEMEPGKHLWAYTHAEAAARACLLSVEGSFKGHEVFYIVAPDTTIDTASLELAAKHFPDVPIRGDLSGRTSFFSSTKAEKLLGWTHNQDQAD